MTSVCRQNLRSRPSDLAAEEIVSPVDQNDPTNTKSLPSNLNSGPNVEFPGPTSPCDPRHHIITQHDIGRHGLIIKTPGYYKFSSDLVFKPCSEFQAAIIIAAAGVILDLSKYALVQRNKQPNTYGVVVARDVARVKITGQKGLALIRNFTLAGIRVLGRTQFVSIENLIVAQDVPRQLSNDQIPAECKNILGLSLNLGIAVGEGDTFGVHMQDTNKKNLVDQFSLTDTTVTGSTIGCQIIFTFGFEVARSIFTRNTYYGLLNGTGWAVPGDGPLGLEFPVGGNGIIADSRFEHNHGLNYDLSNPGDKYIFDFVSAVAHYEVSNVSITNCIVADNSNNGYIIAADHDGARNITWTNSFVTKVRSVFEPADGLHFSGSIPFTVGTCTGVNYPLIQDFDITVKNCNVADCVSRDSRASGFVFAYVQGAHVSGCNASGIAGGTSAFGFDIVGGLPGGRTSNVTLVHNTAERNGVTGGGRAAGFTIENVSDNIVLKNNIANGNGTSPNLEYGAGILVRSDGINPGSVIKNIEIDGCTLIGNGNNSANSGGIVILNLAQPRVLPIENVAIEKSVAKFNQGHGILIQGDIIGTSVNESELYQNTLIGLAILGSEAGFISRNVAARNRHQNYQGVPLDNIMGGTIIKLPPQPGFLNVSIV